MSNYQRNFWKELMPPQRKEVPRRTPSDRLCRFEPNVYFPWGRKKSAPWITNCQLIPLTSLWKGPHTSQHNAHVSSILAAIHVVIKTVAKRLLNRTDFAAQRVKYIRFESTELRHRSGYKPGARDLSAGATKQRSRTASHS